MFFAKKKLPIKELALFGVIVFFMIIISLIAKNYTPLIQDYLDIGPAGYGVYIIISILSVVLAPMNMLFLIPIATILWGPALTAFLSIIGWTIGAQIAFEIARKGKNLLRKLVSMEKLKKFEKKMPQHCLFMSILALRVLIPVDILSYAIGFFTPINRVPYFFASLIGTTPFALIFAYLGAVSLEFQILLIFIGIVLLLISWRALKNKS